jgi:hypothetical protein
VGTVFVCVLEGRAERMRGGQVGLRCVSSLPMLILKGLWSHFLRGCAGGECRNGAHLDSREREGVDIAVAVIAAALVAKKDLRRRGRGSGGCQLVSSAYVYAIFATAHITKDNRCGGRGGGRVGCQPATCEFVCDNRRGPCSQAAPAREGRG